MNHQFFFNIQNGKFNAQLYAFSHPHYSGTYQRLLLPCAADLMDTVNASEHATAVATTVQDNELKF